MFYKNPIKSLCSNHLLEMHYGIKIEGQSLLEQKDFQRIFVKAIAIAAKGVGDSKD